MKTNIIEYEFDELVKLVNELFNDELVGPDEFIIRMLIRLPHYSVEASRRLIYILEKSRIYINDLDTPIDGVSKYLVIRPSSLVEYYLNMTPSDRRHINRVLRGKDPLILSVTDSMDTEYSVSITKNRLRNLS